MPPSVPLEASTGHLAVARTLAGGAGFGDLEPASETAAQLPGIIDAIAAEHRPSASPFFGNLSALSPQVASDPTMLGELFLVYQAAMHATRAAVYYMPHLDNPAMRKRKLQIFVDDDGLTGATRITTN